MLNCSIFPYKGHGFQKCIFMQKHRAENRAENNKNFWKKKIYEGWHSPRRAPSMGGGWGIFMRGLCRKSKSVPKRDVLKVIIRYNNFTCFAANTLSLKLLYQNSTSVTSTKSNTYTRINIQFGWINIRSYSPWWSNDLQLLRIIFCDIVSTLYLADFQCFRVLCFYLLLTNTG